MVVYPDASAIVALFKPEVHSPKARAILAGMSNAIAVSDFAVAEVSAAFAALYRGRPPVEVVERYGVLDRWVAAVTTGSLTTGPADVGAATAFVRHAAIRLRAADALHLAICRRVGAALLTFDDRQAAAAMVLGIALAA